MKVKLTTEEKKLAKKEYDAIYCKNNRERISKRAFEYNKNRKEERKVYAAEYYIEQKDWIKEKSNKYYVLYPEKCKERMKNYRENNATKVRKHKKEDNLALRNKMFDILGRKCASCGEDNISFLTIDHVNGNGRSQRIKFNNLYGEIRDLKMREWPEEEIKSNYQILCFNHNCGKNRNYLNENRSDLNKGQKYSQRLWKEAFSFFGPCSCGQDNLQFLTIDHIHDDGAERRRSGENFGSNLLRKFRQLGWIESLKEDYQLLCYNHNCSKNFEVS